MSSTPPRAARANRSRAPRRESEQAFYDARTYATDQSYGYLLRRLYASMQRHVERRMQPLDLTALQWAPLLLIAEGRGKTAAELARRMDIDTGAMTRMLDRLEAKGLVARARSASDRRVVHLELTVAGEEAARRIPHVLVDVLNLHLRDFSAAELTTLMGFLERMLLNGASSAPDGKAGGAAP